MDEELTPNPIHYLTPQRVILPERILSDCPECGKRDKLMLVGLYGVIAGDTIVSVYWIECIRCKYRGPRGDKITDAIGGWNNDDMPAM